jgi:hypothetical protein
MSQVVDSGTRAEDSDHIATQAILANEEDHAVDRRDHRRVALGEDIDASMPPPL